MNAKPVFDTAGDEMNGDDEENDGGHQGQGNKGQHQFGFELGPQYLFPSFEDQLEDVSEDEEDEKKKKEEVDSDERDDQYVAGHRNLVTQLRDVGLKEEEQTDPEQEN